MLRRIHVPSLYVGEIPLEPAQAHHAREVLRLADGTPVEVFDNDGSVASGVLIFAGPNNVAIRVDRVDSGSGNNGIRITVASAIPKGERADWMVEKLSELGVYSFIPLATERSVVKPQGTSKYDRWARIATESAKQSRRRGVMRIQELTELEALTRPQAPNDERLTLYLSTRTDAMPFTTAIGGTGRLRDLLLFVGPEGGWTDGELRSLENAGAMGAKLTESILRIETAAIVGATAAILVCGQSP